MIFAPPPSGAFMMGASPGDPDARPDEKPAHPVRLRGFWIDRTEVTNAQFAAFVNATNYITTAERPIDWNELRKQLPPGTPRPPDEQLRPAVVGDEHGVGVVPARQLDGEHPGEVGVVRAQPRGPLPAAERLGPERPHRAHGIRW